VATSLRNILISACMTASLCALAACGGHAQTTPRSSRVAKSAPCSVTTVVLPFRQFGNACKVGQSLFVAVDTGGGRLATLIRYNLASKETTTILSSGDDIASVDANTDWLVWETNGKLFAQSLRSGERQVVSSSRDLFAPALEGNTLAWSHKIANDKHEVVVYDLVKRTGKVIAPIAFAELYNNFVQIHEGKLVWTDIVHDEGHYRVYDIPTGKLDDYTLSGIPYRYPGYAIPWADRVYSINFRNTTEWDWTDQKLGYYSLPDKHFVAIPTGGYINYFRIVDGYLAIVDANQRLSLRPLANPTDARQSQTVLNVPIDSLESSDRKTLIAGWGPPGQRSVTIYVMEFR